MSSLTFRSLTEQALLQQSNPLPMDLTIDILSSIWCTDAVPGSEGWNGRWDLYRKACLVSKDWNAAVTRIVLRHIAIETRRDFDLYCRISKHRFGVDPDSKDVERVHPNATSFFQYSTIYLVLAESFYEGYTFRWRIDYAQMPHYIPTCRRLELRVKELPGNDRHTLPYYPIFECLSNYHTAQTMRLSWAGGYKNRYILPKSRVTGVTHLRLHQIPRCNCRAPAPSIPPLPTHRRDCFSYYLPTLFPDLVHLHIETDYLLKGLATVSTLQKLTIESPPVYPFPGGLGYYSTLVHWNIVSAVKAGLLMKTVDKGSPRKCIVVNAGPDKPWGWNEIARVCEEHEVNLQLCHVYPIPCGDVKNDGTPVQTMRI